MDGHGWSKIIRLTDLRVDLSQTKSDSDEKMTISLIRSAGQYIYARCFS